MLVGKKHKSNSIVFNLNNLISPPFSLGTIQRLMSLQLLFILASVVAMVAVQSYCNLISNSNKNIHLKNYNSETNRAQSFLCWMIACK